MQRLLSMLVWLAVVLIVAVWLPLLTVLFLFTAPFDRGRYTVGRWFRRAAVVFTALNPFWTFRTSGVTISDPRRPYVVVSNHESLADIFLISHLPWEMKWLSKEAIFKIPIMGWMMRMAGDIAVRRGDRRSRLQALEECRQRLEQNVSVMIMPEGTRSTGDELLPFKDGAFRLAIETQSPVLPLAVAGTRDAIPKHSLVFGRAVAEVRALEPIATTGLTMQDVPELRDRVQSLIAETRKRLLAELRTGQGSD